MNLSNEKRYDLSKSVHLNAVMKSYATTLRKYILHEMKRKERSRPVQALSN